MGMAISIPLHPSSAGLAARCGGQFAIANSSLNIAAQWKFFGFGDFHDSEANNFPNLISFLCLCPKTHLLYNFYEYP